MDAGAPFLMAVVPPVVGVAIYYVLALMLTPRAYKWISRILAFVPSIVWLYVSRGSELFGMVQFMSILLVAVLLVLAGFAARLARRGEAE